MSTPSTLPRAIGAPVEVGAASSAADWIDVAFLLHEYVEWIRDVAGFDPLVAQPGFGAELMALPSAYDGVDATMFLARRRGRPVGTLGVRRIETTSDDDGVELTRMYVRPEARGQGVADALLDTALETSARLGANVARLESLRGPMDAAIAVYHRHGFRPTDEPGSLPLAGLATLARRL